MNLLNGSSNLPTGIGPVCLPLSSASVSFKAKQCQAKSVTSNWQDVPIDLLFYIILFYALHVQIKVKASSTNLSLHPHSCVASNRSLPLTNNSNNNFLHNIIVLSNMMASVMNIMFGKHVILASD